MHITSSNLESSVFSHGFFTREGGVSTGIYASLNCGPGSGDDLQKVSENRARTANQLGAKTLLTAYQIHSNKAFIVTKPWQPQDAPQADALVTNVPSIAIGVLTADCLPIFLADGKHRVIAAVHAGWRGAYDGVIEAALTAMNQLGAEITDITAAIGPAIAQKSYEVDDEFYARFILQDIHNQRYFTNSTRAGHAMFDLPAYAHDRLKKSGIANINLLAHDTCFEENRFFSYRRATLRGEHAYGRQVSAIVINPVSRESGCTGS